MSFWGPTSRWHIAFRISPVGTGEMRNAICQRLVGPQKLIGHDNPGELVIGERSEHPRGETGLEDQTFQLTAREGAGQRPVRIALQRIERAVRVVFGGPG